MYVHVDTNILCTNVYVPFTLVRSKKRIVPEGGLEYKEVNDHIHINNNNKEMHMYTAFFYTLTLSSPVYQVETLCLAFERFVPAS